MDVNQDALLLVIGLLVILALSMFVIPYYMIKRAVGQVVDIFLKNGVTSESSARYPYELGLAQPAMMSRFFRRKDYKPQAMDVLIRAAVLAVTDDGKIFLVMSNLLNSALNKDNKYGVSGNTSE